MSTTGPFRSFVPVGCLSVCYSILNLSPSALTPRAFDLLSTSPSFSLPLSFSLNLHDPPIGVSPRLSLSLFVYGPRFFVHQTTVHGISRIPYRTSHVHFTASFTVSRGTIANTRTLSATVLLGPTLTSRRKNAGRWCLGCSVTLSLSQTLFN